MTDDTDRLKRIDYANAVAVAAGVAGSDSDTAFCLRQINSLRKQLDAAKAIVDKRRKTADGVPVEAGDKVYAFDPTGCLQGYDVQGMTLWDDSSWPSPSYRPIQATYSTPEAAEAARKAQEEGK